MVISPELTPVLAEATQHRNSTMLISTGHSVGFLFLAHSMTNPPLSFSGLIV